MLMVMMTALATVVSGERARQIFPRERVREREREKFQISFFSLCLFPPPPSLMYVRVCV